MLFVVELLFELLASGWRSTTSAPNSGVECHVLFHLLLFGLGPHWGCVEIYHCVQMILGFGLVKVMAMFKRTTKSLVSLGLGFGGKWELVVVCAGFSGFYSWSPWDHWLWCPTLCFLCKNQFLILIILLKCLIPLYYCKNLHHQWHIIGKKTMFQGGNKQLIFGSPASTKVLMSSSTHKLACDTLYFCLLHKQLWSDFKWHTCTCRRVWSSARSREMC